MSLLKCWDPLYKVVFATEPTPFGLRKHCSPIHLATCSQSPKLKNPTTLEQVKLAALPEDGCMLQVTPGDTQLTFPEAKAWALAE